MPKPMATADTTHPREAEALLERLRICAFAALDAARSGDVERLRRAMEEREELMARAEPLMARARVAVAADGAGGGGARRSLLLTMQGLQAADARLLAALEHRRADVGEELLKLQQDARSPRYRPARRTGQNLDLRR